MPEQSATVTNDVAVQRTTRLSVALGALGLAAYYTSGRTSVTALIPCLFAIVMWVLKFFMKTENQKQRMIAAHIAVLVAIAGAGACFRAGLALMAWVIDGIRPSKPQAVLYQITTAALCIDYIFFCVRWFISNRKARKATQKAK